MSSSTIAVISDIHDKEYPGSLDVTLALTARAVHRLNRFIKPDITVILGDLVDDPRDPDALDRLRRIKETLDLLKSPYIVIPGNRDPKADQFYTVFDRPQPYIDCGHVRLVPFLDRFHGGFPLTRSKEDLERLAAARVRYSGPIVALQHVPVKPPGGESTGSIYANVDEVNQAFEAAGVTLSIGGHYHATKGLERVGQCAHLAVKAFRDAPFTFTVVHIDGTGRIEGAEHQLQMPRSLELIDVHTHSEFAYCSKAMRMNQTPLLADLFGLAGVALTEHSGQLYFERSVYWKGAFCEQGIETIDGRDERIDAYWQAVDLEWDGSLWAGLEIDADYRGGLVVRPEDFRRSEIRNGAVHYLRELRKREHADPDRVADEFMQVTQGIVQSGIDVLVHPFRVFRRAGLPVPERLFEPVARLLAKHGVAAEINFHTNEPDPRFFEICLDLGVQLAFGSDAHEIWEVGEFAPHLRLLEECGFDGDVRDILWTPPPNRIRRDRRKARD